MEQLRNFQIVQFEISYSKKKKLNVKKKLISPNAVVWSKRNDKPKTKFYYNQCFGLKLLAEF